MRPVPVVFLRLAFIPQLSMKDKLDGKCGLVRGEEGNEWM